MLPFRERLGLQSPAYHKWITEGSLANELCASWTIEEEKTREIFKVEIAGALMGVVA